MSEQAAASTLNVVVLGMHRSGTSAVAAALHAAGLSPGADAELVGALPENPDGFAERPDVVGVDERLLASLGWSWDAPDAVPPATAAERPMLVDAARELVKHKLDGHQPWAIKDPRMSLLLPWWRQVLLDRFVAVVTVRDAREVAWSLALRDGFTPELGMALWAAYHRHLAAGLAGLPVVTVDFAALTGEPERLTAELLAALERLGVRGSLDRAAAAGAIKPVLRRATQPDDHDRSMAELALSAAEQKAWLGGDLGINERFDLTPSAPQAWEVAILAAQRSVRAARDRHEELRAELGGARAHAAALGVERANLARTVNTLQTELAQRSTELAQARARNAEQEKSIQDLTAARQTLIAQNARSMAGRERARGRFWPRELGRAARTSLLRGLARVTPPALLATVWHNPLFDRSWYLEHQGDVAAKRMNPERHFRRHGARERRNPNAMFDVAWYLDHYPDVARSGLNPLDHYLLFGAAEGRDPGPQFSTNWYLAHNPDVVRSGNNPLLHYLRYGQAEGRATGPRLMSTATERTTWAAPGAAAMPRPVRALVAPVARPQATRVDRSSTTAPRAVVLHLFHTDLWPEFRSYLDTLGDFRLFVSLCRETGDGFDAQIRADFSAADVRYLPNRGRDMGPFVEFMAEGVFDDCELVCKIHSKRSPHRVDGDDWRRRLLDELLGTPATVRQIEAAFAADPKLGLLGPADALTESDRYWGANRDRVYELGQRMGQPRDKSKLSFFAGSMFWFRPRALSKLRELGLRITDFEPEAGQVDGALQHALERAVPIAVNASGYHLTPFEPPSRRQPAGTSIGGRDFKLIAFYLPQFHAVPENDEWWGEGFTEWTQVRRSEPLFEGHHQPRLPTTLGFYDLTNPEVRLAQTALARQYGIGAFCYYYYWFDGRRILERPLNEVLASGEPDFPFLICWANENWTRRWDGLDQDVLLAQSYSPESNLRFIRDVIPVLRDPRYLRYEGKPVLLVYRVSAVPDIKATVELWREECRRAGVGEIHLAAARFWDTLDVQPLGFDAAVEFPPHHVAVKKVERDLPNLVEDFAGLAYDYEHVVRENLKNHERPDPALTHRGLMLAWDNTPRRGPAAHFAHGATPELYRQWLSGVIDQELRHGSGRESLVFINAWNEWGEGANLEPDSVFGSGFLEATRAAIDEAQRSQLAPRK
jgi:lipopolysaccharide biosynthesis protein